jgi:glycosyltransferase involved in cell wall biosynthesis
MSRLSVVIITFNEQDNIERCLLSIKDIADEILVIDSYSTDKTEKICEKHNVRFVRHKFEGHVEQKNWAFDQTTYHHVLSIDADEELSERLIESIKKVKKDWRYDGYYFNRLNNYCGKWIRFGGWYPDKKLRLVDKRKGSWGGINPHDKFELLNGEGKYHLKGNLLHYSYKSIPHHIQQINKYSDIFAMSHYKVGKKSSYINIIGNPTWKFFRNYFLRLGFLDGFSGLIVNFNVAYETFLKYVKLRQLNKYPKLKIKIGSPFLNIPKSEVTDNKIDVKPYTFSA